MSPGRITLAFGILAGVLLCAGAVVGLERASHGLDLVVEARAGHDGYFPVHHGFEPRPAFRSRHRLNAIVLQKWNFRAHPVPTGPVPYRVTLRGLIEVPEGASWSLRVRPTRGTRLRIESAASELAPGRHPVHITLEATFPEDASVALEYLDHRAAGSGFARVHCQNLAVAFNAGRAKQQQAKLDHGHILTNCVPKGDKGRIS